MDEEEIRRSAALEERHWWYAERRALVRRLVSPLSPGRALDVEVHPAGECLRQAPVQVVTPSPVLTAMGLDADRAAGAVRLSLGGWSTEADVDTAATTLARRATSPR